MKLNKTRQKFKQLFTLAVLTHHIKEYLDVIKMNGINEITGINNNKKANLGTVLVFSNNIDVLLIFCFCLLPINLFILLITTKQSFLFFLLRQDLN